MNRPTRNTLLGCVLCLILAGFYSCAAKAQGAPPDLQEANDISQRYNECVYDSAVSQMKPGLSNDVNLLAEQAFQSCASETAELVLFLKQHGVPAATIEATLLKKKTGIKRELRKMVEEVWMKQNSN